MSSRIPSLFDQDFAPKQENEEQLSSGKSKKPSRAGKNKEPKGEDLFGSFAANPESGPSVATNGLFAVTEPADVTPAIQVGSTTIEEHTETIEAAEPVAIETDITPAMPVEPTTIDEHTETIEAAESVAIETDITPAIPVEATIVEELAIVVEMPEPVATDTDDVSEPVWAETETAETATPEGSAADELALLEAVIPDLTTDVPVAEVDVVTESETSTEPEMNASPVIIALEQVAEPEVVESVATEDADDVLAAPQPEVVAVSETPDGKNKVVKPKRTRKAAEQGVQPDLPADWKAEKQYYTIGEVAALFQVNTSHIRFWTNEFNLKVRTTRKGDRLYTGPQIQELKAIHHLVKERGFKIAGAKARLKDQKKKEVQSVDLKESLVQLRNRLIIMRKQLN